MRKTFAMIMVIVLVLGVAGIGLSEESGTPAPGHDDFLTCPGTTGQGGADSSVLYSERYHEGNLGFYESLLRNGIEVPDEKFARAGSEPCMKEEAGG